MLARRLPVPQWLLLLSLGLAALTLRTLHWWRTPAMFNDGPVFIELGRAMAAGDWTTALGYDQHPGYSFLTMLVQGVSGDWVAAAVVVSIVSGVAAVLFLYALLHDAFDRRVAWVGGLLLAAHPHAVAYSADVQSDGLYLAAFVGALALLWRALDRRSSRFAVAAGLAAGAAYLVRPEGAGVVLIGLGLVGLELARRRWPFPSAARWVVALGLGAALAMAPYATLLSVRNGTLTFSQKKSIERLLGVGDIQRWMGLSVVPAPDGPDASALSELTQNTLSSARYQIALLALLGVIALRGRPGLRGRFVLVSLGLYSLVLYALIREAGYVSRRHTLPLAVLMLGYAAVGVPVLGHWILRAGQAAARSHRPIGVGAALVAGLVVALGLELGKGLRPHRLNAVSERRAAEWLRETSTSGAAVAAGKHRIAFYAEAPFVNLAHLPADTTLLPRLRRSGVRYLVLDEDEHQSLLASTTDPETAVRLLHQEEAHGHAAFVYELLPPTSTQILE